MTNETQQVEISAGHTPGPWVVHYVARTGGTTAALIWSDEYGTIVPEVSGDANAQLIAAAPDLLEALEGLTDSVEVLDGLAEVDRARIVQSRETARAAIRKARGEGENL